jgi:hypothetical protein
MKKQRRTHELLSLEDLLVQTTLLRKEQKPKDAVESWLNNQVGPAYDALKADPSRAITVEQVRARLTAEHAKTR